MAEQIIDIRERIEKMRIKFEDEHKSEIYDESIHQKKDSPINSHFSSHLQLALNFL
mgnify:CR=1 FL=1